MGIGCVPDWDVFGGLFGSVVSFVGLGLSWVPGLVVLLCVALLLCLCVLVPANGLAASISIVVLGFCSVLFVCRFWSFGFLVVVCVYSGGLLAWVWAACVIEGGR